MRGNANSGKRCHVVEEPAIGLTERLYLPALFAGLRTTVKHMFQPAVTTQFPEEQPKLPPNYRGVHRLNRDEQDRVKCVACYMCSTACPAHCIDIVAAPSPGLTGEIPGNLCHRRTAVHLLRDVRRGLPGGCDRADITLQPYRLEPEEMMFDKRSCSAFSMKPSGPAPIQFARKPAR